jgi:hypothetical protein
VKACFHKPGEKITGGAGGASGFLDALQDFAYGGSRCAEGVE